jgi:uncharacterized repeat protein (TIGR01451 family)
MQSFNATVLGKPGDLKTDTVTAVAEDSLGRAARAVDQAQVEILDIPSTIVVVKTADPTHLPEPGGDVTFTVTVRNTSTVDNVTIHTVVDDRFGNIAATCAPARRRVSTGPVHTVYSRGPSPANQAIRIPTSSPLRGLTTTERGQEDDDATVVMTIPILNRGGQDRQSVLMYHPAAT